MIGTAALNRRKALPHLLPVQAGGDGYLAGEEGKIRRFNTVRDVLCSFTLFIHSRVVTEKAMAPHSSTFAWKIPWTEEPGRLQSMGSLESDTTEAT